MQPGDCIIAIAQDQQANDGIPIIIVGVSQSALDLMKQGGTNFMNLSNQGIRCKVLILGGETIEDVVALIKNGAAEISKGAFIDPELKAMGETKQ